MLSKSRSAAKKKLLKRYSLPKQLRKYFTQVFRYFTQLKKADWVIKICSYKSIDVDSIPKNIRVVLGNE